MLKFPWISSVFKNLVDVIYPDLCWGCYEKNPLKEHFLCLTCNLNFEYSDTLDNPIENTFTAHFDGRFPLFKGVSYTNFEQEGIIQSLLYQIKYENRPYIAYRIGLEFAKQLESIDFFNDIDVLIPVPLHAKKLRERGYNQSEVFANGLAHQRGLPVLTDVLIKNTHTASQTKMNRAERIANVRNHFEVLETTLLKNKHILIVDDVLTTGATLESCALQLQNNGHKISAITIAMGHT